MKNNVLLWLILLAKLIVDVFIINIAFILAYFFVSKISHQFVLFFNLYVQALVFITMTWLVIFNLMGFYGMQYGISQRSDKPKVIIWGTVLSALVTFFIVTVLYRNEAIYPISFIIVCSAWFISTLLLLIFREVMWKLQLKYCNYQLH